MLRTRFHLFTLFGFRVGLDPTWFLLAILIVWSLGQAYFPTVLPGADAAVIWTLAVLSALGLFASIVFHEFAHAIVARRFDMPIAGITLFIFGGVAEMKREPPSAKAEFWVAIAGPIASYILAAAGWLAALALGGAGLQPAVALFSYLAVINLVLATFNLLPAFPLDGGRVLRAGVWWWTGDLGRATRSAALMGRILGGALIALGVLSIVSGSFVGGMWQALIGLFIIGAAGATEMHTEMRLGLQDVAVGRVMTRDPVAVPADVTVQDLVDDYFYTHFHKMFPVVEGGKVIGCVRLKDVGKLERSDWPAARVRDIVAEDSGQRTVPADMPVHEAMQRMRDADASRLVVADDGRLAGILTMRDVMSFLEIRRELEGRGFEGRAPRRAQGRAASGARRSA